MKKRVLYFDMAKAFAILCVVLAHTQYEMPGRFLLFAFSFHMPIFFIASGYFFKSDHPDKEFLKKSFKSLIIPYIMVGLGIIVITVVKNLCAGNALMPDVTKWISAMFYGSGSRKDWSYWPTKVYIYGATWFFLALFWCRVFLASILHLGKDSILFQIVAVALISYAGYYMSENGEWFPLSLYAGMTATLFLYVGYLCRWTKAFDRPWPVWIYLVLILIWGWSILEGGRTSMVKNQYPDGLMSILVGIGSPLLLIRFFQFWEEKIKLGSKIIGYIGSNTLTILCVHMIEGKFISYTKDIPNLLEKLNIPANWYTVCLVRCLIVAAGTTLVIAVQYLWRRFRHRNIANAG